MPTTKPLRTDEPHSLHSGIRPLVILGAARSGTKFLRSLLASSAACAAVPHGVNFIWRHGAQAHPNDAVPAASYSDETHQYIRNALFHLSGAARDSSIRFVVERTCANTLRLPAVHAVLPDARYVHIVRDGRDVAASAREQWTQSPSRLHQLRKLMAAPRAGWTYLKNRLTARSTQPLHPLTGWGPRYPGMQDDVQKYSIAEVCALQWKACVDLCQRDLSSLLSPDRYFTVSYERLVTSAESVTEICEFADLPDPSAVLTRYRETVRADSVGRWKRSFDPHTTHQVHTLIAPTLQRLGYSI